MQTLKTYGPGHDGPHDQIVLEIDEARILARRAKWVPAGSLLTGAGCALALGGADTLIVQILTPALLLAAMAVHAYAWTGSRRQAGSAVAQFVACMALIAAAALVLTRVL